MNPLCYELLQNGGLNFTGDTGTYPVTTVTNQLPIDIQMQILPLADGTLPYASGSPWTFGPGQKIGLASDDQAPGYYIIKAALSGALIDVINISAGQPTAVSIGKAQLSAPNDIGPIPIPTASMSEPVEPQPVPPRPNSSVVIPADSARVLVGCGITPSGNFITREQFWSRQNDSVCLAGHESRTVSYTVTSGRQETSSTTETMSASLSASVSGGWGPVSASVSASLSAGTTQLQQVTATEQATSYVSHTITNPHEEPVAYLRWQLMDIVTVFDKTTHEPVSSLIQAENPTVVMGPYWVSPTQQPPASKGGAGAGLFDYK